MKVISYARVSTAKQEDNTSLSEQHRINKLFIERHNLELIAEKQDVMTGTVFEARPGMAEVVSLLQEKKAQGVIIYSVDRAARGEAVFLDFITAIFEAEASLGVSSTGSLFDNYDDAEEGLSLHSLLSTLDHQTINRRFNRGKRAAIESGSWMWRPPPGYRTVRKDGIKILEPTDEAEQVRFVLELATTETRPVEITRRLNAEFNESRNLQTIQRWIGLADVFAGLPFEKTYTVKGKKLTGTYTAPPLIDMATYERLKKPRIKRPRKGKIKPMAGNVWCTCGEQATVMSANNKGIYSFVCRSRNRERVNRHQGKRLDSQTLCRKHVSHNRIVEAVRDYFSGDFVKAAQDFLDEIQHQIFPAINKDTNKLTQALEETRQKKKEIEERLISIDIETLKSLAPAFNNQLEQLTREEEEYLAKLDEQSRRLANLQRILETAQLGRIDFPTLSEAMEAGDWETANRLMFEWNIRVVVDFRTGQGIDAGPGEYELELYPVDANVHMSRVLAVCINRPSVYSGGGEG